MLSELKSQTTSLGMLFGQSYFTPAAVQREYQWTSSECAALLVDFERAWRTAASDSKSPQSNTQPYFLGSFVLCPVNGQYFEVFDGLQRLTTLTILFAVLRDLLDGQSADMHRALCETVHDGHGAPRLKLGGADQTLANLIQAHSEAARRRHNLSENTLRARLLSAAGLFKSRLSELTPEQLAGFSDYILNHIYVGIIEVSDERLARQIFITTNNRGIPLSEPDVLKSQINSIPLRQDVANRVLETWTFVRSSFENDQDYTTFLYAMDFLTRRKGRGAVGLTGLGEYLSNSLDDNGLLEWLVDYEEYAKVWHWLNAVKADPNRNDPSKGSIFRLNVFEWPEWHAVALRLALDILHAQNDRDKRRLKTLVGRFHGLERACLAMTLADTPETDRVKFMVRSIADVEKGRNPSTSALQHVMSDVEKLTQVVTVPAFDEKIASQALKWLELFESKKQSIEVLDLMLDRVLPKHALELSAWERDFPDKDQRWQLSHAWGNLVLVPSEYADHGEFNDFKHKRKVLSKQRVRSASLADVTRHQNWNANTIKQRSLKMQSSLRQALTSA